MRRISFAVFAVLAVGLCAAHAQDAGKQTQEQKPSQPASSDTDGTTKAPTDGAEAGKQQPASVKKVAIRAPRDIGYFQGDLVSASIEIDVDPAYEIVAASLPQPGPLNYWLDLRKIAVEKRALGTTNRYTLKILYQDFYVALDARQQEVPAFTVDFSDGKQKIVAKVPPWTIGVSPLREISPAPKEEPKDYLRADERAPNMNADPYWITGGAAGVATLLALLLLARDRLWWPFHPRPARVFAEAQNRLKSLAKHQESPEAYLEALLVLHRGIDRTYGQRVLADDMPRFLDSHPRFVTQRGAFARFFAASRAAFFGSDPQRARADLGFGALQGFARQLAAIERTQP